ncbi:MAG: caspase family protein [Elusimicrobia bacterium]|nr:caspase family protein [Elusimicrobiota bacterium]
MEISGDKRAAKDRWFLRTTLAMTLSLTGKDGRQLWTGDLSGRGDNENAPNAYSPSSMYTTSLNEALADALGKLGSILEQDMVVALISPTSSPRPALRAEPGRPAAPAKEAPERVVHSDIDDLPSRGAAAKPNAHAVVIGVRRYRQKLPEADFADSDAQLVSRYLIQVLGYQTENVAVLIDDQAQKSDFEKYFEQWLPNRVEKGDEVFVYYSGHGAPNPTTGDAYLVPFDGDPTYLPETAYPLKKMYAALAGLPAKRTTVVMDSCFSGAGGRSLLAKGARPLVMSLSNGVVPTNMAVLTASAGDQITYAYDEKGHGLFTYFLLKGIKEGRGDGGAGLRGVFDYAAPLVSRIARREFNNDQVPQWQGDPR